jgi:hypothetical protein
VEPVQRYEPELELAGRTSLLASYRSMAIAPAIAVAVGIGLAIAHPLALPVAAPILLLWGGSPAIAWWVSRPLGRRSTRLALGQLHFLRKLARKTWAYFETHVGPDDHWLPPDNLQESPAVGIAHRTSPTNMGLSLLANLTAHDFGYLSTGQLIERTTKRTSHDGDAGEDIGAISTTGTTRRRDCLWRLCTYRRWIAAISRATS